MLSVKQLSHREDSHLLIRGPDHFETIGKINGSQCIFLGTDDYSQLGNRSEQLMISFVTSGLSELWDLSQLLPF